MKHGAAPLARVLARRLAPLLPRRLVDALLPGKAAQTPFPSEVPFRPVNYLARDPSEIDAEVTSAITTAREIAKFVREAGIPLEGAHFLEVGPGTHFGAQLILASMGLRVTLADRFLAGWQSQYHPVLYRELRRRWDGPTGALDAVIEADGYPSEALTLLEEPAEGLASVGTGTVDFTYSNAVLEHVYDMDRVAAEMARVMRPGAAGAHQIDMRYHADFERPLEHLIMSEDEYAREVAVHGYERGNRLRVSEFTALFKRHGLEVSRFVANVEPTPAYFADALKRLRAADSKYRDWAEEDLRPVGGRFFIRRTS